MIQEILAYTSIGIAIIYTLIRILRKRKKESECNGCSSDCSHCSVSELVNKNHNKK
ncbi:MAG: FeoB-associated Cys-rich membrane protein [Bacteroidales bacterium]|nr:FeoB-associated Cys-rich membrane protein [Bacteroidales bacterium]